MKKWFYLSWWKYLLKKPALGSTGNWWQRFKCRAKRHPNGCIWINMGGNEPDYHCVDCGEYLG